MNAIETIETRLGRLEGEIADLRAKSAPKIAPAPKIERGVTITRPPVVSLNLPDPYPSEGELDRLFATVIAAYPSLAPNTRYENDARADKIKREHRAGFAEAFRGLCHVRRRAEVDRAHYLSYWSDHVANILRAQRLPAEQVARGFAAAVIAHHDIPHTHPEHKLHYAMSVALCIGDASSAYHGAWRRTLETGRVPQVVQI